MSCRAGISTIVLYIAWGWGVGVLGEGGKEGWDRQREGTAYWGGAKGGELSTPFRPFHVQRLYIHIKQHVTYANKLLLLFCSVSNKEKKDTHLCCFFLFFCFILDFKTKWHMFSSPISTSLNLLYKYRLLNKTIDHWINSQYSLVY